MYTLAYEISIIFPICGMADMSVRRTTPPEWIFQPENLRKLEIATKCPFQPADIYAIISAG